MDVASALVQLGGAGSWRRLRASGVTWYGVWSAVTAGRVVRLRRGAYALPEADPVMTAVVALGGVLSCTSAAAYLGLPVLLRHGTHVTVPRSWGHARRTGVRVHRREVRPDEQDGVATSLLRTVVDCGRELPLRESVVVADAALRAGLRPDDLALAVGRLRGRGAAAARRMLAACDGRAESPIESCARLLVRDLGVLLVQPYISGVGRVDFLLDGWLVVEVDGFAYHAGRDEYREDRRRANALTLRGFVLLRFSYEDVVQRPHAVVATVQAALAMRSQRGHTTAS